MMDRVDRLFVLFSFILCFNFVTARCYGRDALGTCSKIKDKTFQVQGVEIDETSRFRRQANPLRQHALRGNVNPNYGRATTTAYAIPAVVPALQSTLRPQKQRKQPTQLPVSGGYNDFGETSYSGAPKSPPKYVVSNQPAPSNPKRPAAPVQPVLSTDVAAGDAYNVTSSQKKGSRWGNDVHSTSGGALVNALNAKYYYPPKPKFPLPRCFYNPSGYVCCNEELNNIMVDTVSALSANPKYNKCNIGIINAAIQQKAEERFETPFEAITALDDFAQTIHFSGDLVCKIEIDGKVIITYSTPYAADQAVEPVDDKGENAPTPALLPSSRLRM